MAVNPLHLRLQATAQRLIASHGRTLGLVTREPGTGNPWAVTPGEITETQVLGVEISGGSFPNTDVNGKTPTSTQLVFLIAGTSPVAPTRGMVLRDGVLPLPPPPPITVGLTDPTEGEYLGGSSRVFTWTAADLDVTLWELVVGTVLNGNDLHSSGALVAGILSANVTGLPTDGSTVYARLGRAVDSVVTYQHYTFPSGVDPSPEEPATDGGAKAYVVQEVEPIAPGELTVVYKVLVER